MIKFIALHFEDGYYIGTPFDLEVVKRLEADVVFLASVERNFAI